MMLPAMFDFDVIKIGEGEGETFSQLCGIEYISDEPRPENLEDWPLWLQPAFLRGRDGPVLEQNPYPEFYRNGRYNRRHEAYEWGTVA